MTDILNAVPPLLMSICLANLQLDQFFLDIFSFFAVNLLVVSCLFRNIGICGKACLPEEDAFKISRHKFKQTL